MKQKKLVITVQDETEKVVFQKDPASLDHVVAAVQLYAEIGNTITLKFVEVQLSEQPTAPING